LVLVVLAGAPTGQAALPPTPAPQIDVQWIGVSSPDIWGRTYDLWEITYVAGGASVWYRVTSAQGMAGTPVVASSSNQPGSAWTAQGFVTPLMSTIVKVLKHVEPGDPFVSAGYKGGWDADPRQICIEYSNNLMGPYSGPICLDAPILLARGKIADLGQITLSFVGISRPTEPKAYLSTRKNWYCWQIQYNQGDDASKTCWFEVQPPNIMTAYPFSGCVKDIIGQKTIKVWTVSNEITLLWTGKNQQVKFSPAPYGPVTARALP
jgi:hypothetical protein